jgi:hypothetical protein
LGDSGAILGAWSGAVFGFCGWALDQQQSIGWRQLVCTQQLRRSQQPV